MSCVTVTHLNQEDILYYSAESLALPVRNADAFGVVEKDAGKPVRLKTVLLALLLRTPMTVLQPLPRHSLFMACMVNPENVAFLRNKG